MTASSVTGTGAGASNKPTGKELAILANGPSIIMTGYTEGVPYSSPPTSGNEVFFPVPLAGGSDSYVVLLTTLNGGYAYVAQRRTNSNDEFTGFTFIVEYECDLMYMVAKVGYKPII